MDHLRQLNRKIEILGDDPILLAYRWAEFVILEDTDDEMFV